LNVRRGFPPAIHNREGQMSKQSAHSAAGEGRQECFNCFDDRQSSVTVNEAIEQKRRRSGDGRLSVEGTNYKGTSIHEGRDLGRSRPCKKTGAKWLAPNGEKATTAIGERCHSFSKLRGLEADRYAIGRGVAVRKRTLLSGGKRDGWWGPMRPYCVSC